MRGKTQQRVKRLYQARIKDYERLFYHYLGRRNACSMYSFEWHCHNANAEKYYGMMEGIAIALGIHLNPYNYQ